jgi:hypothetical protein
MMEGMDKIICAECKSYIKDAAHVACEKCLDYFHCECVGVDPSDSGAEKPFVCSICDPSKPKLPPMRKSNFPRDSQVCGTLLGNSDAAQRNEVQTTTIDALTQNKMLMEAMKMLEEANERNENLKDLMIVRENELMKQMEAQRLEFERFKLFIEPNGHQNEGAISKLPSLGLTSAQKPEANADLLDRFNALKLETRQSADDVESVVRRVRNNSRRNEGSESEMSSASRRDELSTMEKYLIRLNLPKLAEFSGDVRKWPSFKRTFDEQSAEAGFSDVENVRRLDEALKSPARDYVVRWLKSGRNSDRIIATLEEQYGQADNLLATLMEEVEQLPHLRDGLDANLRLFSLGLDDYIDTVKDMGLDDELRNRSMVAKLARKFDDAPGIYKGWKRRKDGWNLRRPTPKTPTLEDLAAYVKELWVSLPEGFRNNCTTNKSKNRGKIVLSHAAVSKPTEDSAVSVISVASSSSNGSSVKLCSYCKGKDHYIWGCSEFKCKPVSERDQIVRELGICFACLRSDHRFNECTRKSECNIDGCKRMHNRLLHNRRNNVKKPVGANGEMADQAQRADAVVHQMNFHSNRSVSTKIVPIRIYGENGNYADTYALLDDGADVTMIEKTLAVDLGITGKQENLSLQWTGNVVAERDALLCDLKCVKNSNKKFQLNNVYAIDELGLPNVTQDAAELQKEFVHLRGLKIPTFENVKPGILIGLEHAKFLNGPQAKTKNEDGPLAMKTKLGWVVYGRTKPRNDCKVLSGLHRQTALVSFHEASKSDDE